MKREQFLRKLKEYARSNGMLYGWRPGEGKGSHGSVYVNGRKTIVKSGELPRIYIDAVLKQLGLGKDVI